MDDPDFIDPDDINSGSFYPGGLGRIVERFEKARKPFERAETYLPDASFDIAALQAQTVPAPSQAPET